MRKTVVFLLEQPLEVNDFQSLCDEIFHDHVLVMSSKYRGYLILEANQISQLKTMQSHLLGHGIALTAVIGYSHNLMLEESLLIAQKYSRFTILHVADVMLMESYDGGRVLFDLFDQQIKQLPHETILTAKAFIENDCNAHATSEALYIHRNTFSYRLNKFIDQTNLDIRDFHFARLLSLWFVLSNVVKD